MDDLLKDAIADAKAVRETALANAKIALEEAFTPRLKSMLSRKIESEMDAEEMEDKEEVEEEKENPTFVQFMKRIDQLPEVTREAIKNCGDDPMIAKAALEISGIDK